MKNAIIGWIAQWIANNITEEDMKRWIATFQAYVMPKLREWRDLLIATLRDLEKDANNPLVSTAVDLVEKFLEALLPDNPTTLADVK